MLSNGETLVTHGVDIAQDTLFIGGAEVWHIQQVVANPCLYLVRQRRRLGILRLSIGRQKAGYHRTIHRWRWKCPWYSYYPYAPARVAQDIPQARNLYRSAVGNNHALLAAISPVAEPVDP